MSTSNSSNNTSIISTGILSVASLSMAYLAYYYHSQNQKTKKEISRILIERQAERTGRIRAEIGLRALVKEKETQSYLYYDGNNNDNNNASNNPKSQNQKMILECLGLIQTPFMKRMGTPRQGGLVPSSRAFLELDSSKFAIELLDGLDQYSHCWLIFSFHANTDTHKNISGSSNSSGNIHNKKKNFKQKTKIKPPRAPKEVGKVGMLATRSPHRVNPLGLSLVEVDYLDKVKKRLYFKGIDLVNGTPIYDVKPFVPWDIPGHFDRYLFSSTSSLEQIQEVKDKYAKRYKVPFWVNDHNDVVSQVTFAEEAKTELYNCMRRNLLAPLYTLNLPPAATKGSSTSVAINDENSNPVDLLAAMETIKQVLSQDPRARTTRGTKTTTTGKTDPYRILFCKVQIEFIITDGKDKDTSEVHVVDIYEACLENKEYVDGIPLINKQEE